MHHLAGLDGVEGALLLEWWLISAAFQGSCSTHDRHPTWILKFLNFGRWPDTPRPNTSSVSQLKQESARQWCQRPAAHRSQKSVDGVVVLHGRSVWRHTAEACAGGAGECFHSFPTKGVISLTQQQKNSVKIEGAIVSTTPETKVKQKISCEVSP